MIDVITHFEGQRPENCIIDLNQRQLYIDLDYTASSLSPYKFRFGESRIRFPPYTAWQHLPGPWSASSLYFRRTRCYLAPEQPQWTCSNRPLELWRTKITTDKFYYLKLCLHVAHYSAKESTEETFSQKGIYHTKAVICNFAFFFYFYVEGY